MRFTWLAWLGVVMAALSCRAAQPADAGLTLGVVSYNIRFDTPSDGEDRWERRREQVYQLIRDHDPDFSWNRIGIVKRRKETAYQ